LNLSLRLSRADTELGYDGSSIVDPTGFNYFKVVYTISLVVSLSV